MAVKVVERNSGPTGYGWHDVVGLTDIPNEISTEVRIRVEKANEAAGWPRFMVQPDPDPVQDEPGATARLGRRPS